MTTVNRWSRVTGSRSSRDATRVVGADVRILFAWQMPTCQFWISMDNGHHVALPRNSSRHGDGFSSVLERIISLFAIAFKRICFSERMRGCTAGQWRAHRALLSDGWLRARRRWPSLHSDDAAIPSNSLNMRERPCPDVATVLDSTPGVVSARTKRATIHAGAATGRARRDTGLGRNVLFM